MFTQHLRELSKGDAAIAGGKGASLGEMTRAGIPVPPGFVVLASAFEHFLEETDLDVEIDSILHTVTHNEMHTVEHASERIQAFILGAKMPRDIGAAIQKEYKRLNAEYVAVRSSATAEDSATAAWAGQLDSFLNTTHDELLQNVQRCWASLFTPRAIFYRFEKGLHTQKISVAVVVQKMVESEVSGIAFSVHPVTEDRNQLIIEAGFGLGEAIVSGQITPDSYVVEKQPRRSIDKNISEQQKQLVRSSYSPFPKGSTPSSEEGIKSSGLADSPPPYRKGGIGESANEWKSIPQEKRNMQKLSDKQILELSELILKIEKHYGFPCDIEWALAGGKFYVLQSRPITTLKKTEKRAPVAGGFETMLGEFASKKWHFTYDRRMSYQRIKLFHQGYCVQLSKFFGVNISSEVYRVKDQNVSVYYEKNEHEAAFRNIQEQILGKTGLALIQRIQKIITSYYKDFTEDIRKRPVDYTAYDFERLKEAYQSFCRLNDAISLPTWLLYLYFEEVLTHALRAKLLESAAHTEADAIIKALSKPSRMTPLDTYTVDLCLAALSGKKRQEKVKTLAEKYISWGVYDVGYQIPDARFHEEKVSAFSPDSAKETIERIERTYEEQSQGVQKVKKEWAHEPYLAALIDLYAFYSDFKDWKNYYREQSSYKLKLLLMEIAARLSVTPDQISYMTEEEIVEALEKKTISNVKEVDRLIRDSAFVYLNNVLHIVTDAAQLAEIDNGLTLTDVSVLSGTVAFPGHAQGPVKIISSTKDFSKVNEGDILVASTTRPDYLPFMRKAAGFITNEGGLLSHAAIMARELKKPCIIGTKIATKVLKDGDMVEVDAEKGIIKIL